MMEVKVLEYRFSEIQGRNGDFLPDGFVHVLCIFTVDGKKAYYSMYHPLDGEPFTKDMEQRIIDMLEECNMAEIHAKELLNTGDEL